ncbi:hypothetical protein EKH77_00430 [Streptomyces luteoverticillatus]|uniref:Lanthionine synthetase n=1 Tax=Streptomyces luteoverticillatus TaxID=66425 RepID=A0A3S9PC53_STRLT|nr:lanthionine synthetase LanC family protein [Streptomyces luteoverticillatus]AZQ69888.1 hypothetical protein EKH77_00430 [Streptomyces luteoverticillatus]
MTGAPGRPWRPLLSPATAATTLARVLSAARPHRVPRRVRPHLAAGAAGLALAYHQLDRCLPGRGWKTLAEDYLAAVAREYERTGASAGLFGGAAGLALAARVLGHDLPTAHTHVVTEASRRAKELGDDPPERALDLVSGLTGAGAHLLGRHHEPASLAALRDVLTALTTAASRRPPPDCGVAHGVSGPLALLALALGEGVTVPGQREAVAGYTALLTERRADDPWGPNWTGPATGTPVRASWCRGSPGIARALWLAGTALGDTAPRELAVRALKAVHRRPAAARRIDVDPGLCHGLAGLLHITARFAHDTGDPELTTAVEGLATARFPRADDPGFLDGAAGVALALLAAATDTEPTWDRALLLA